MLIGGHFNDVAAFHYKAHGLQPRDIGERIAGYGDGPIPGPILGWTSTVLEDGTTIVRVKNRSIRDISFKPPGGKRVSIAQMMR